MSKGESSVAASLASDIIFVQAERLFAEQGLARTQSGLSLPGVKVVTCGNQHGINFCILQKVFF